MSEDLSPEEAADMMEANFVDETFSGRAGTVEVLAARVESGNPELRVLPLDHNDQPVPMNKHWLHLADFQEQYL